MDCSSNETYYYAVYSEKHAEYNRNKDNVSWITSIDDNYSYQRDKIKLKKDIVLINVTRQMLK